MTCTAKSLNHNSALGHSLLTTAQTVRLYTTACTECGKIEVKARRERRKIRGAAAGRRGGRAACGVAGVIVAGGGGGGERDVIFGYGGVNFRVRRVVFRSVWIRREVLVDDWYVCTNVYANG